MGQDIESISLNRMTLSFCCWLGAPNVHNQGISRKLNSIGQNFGSVAMTKHKIRKFTGNYEEWLINSLVDKKEAAIYLQVALEEYQKDGDLEAFLLTLRHVAEAQGGIGKLPKTV